MAKRGGLGGRWRRLVVRAVVAGAAVGVQASPARAAEPAVSVGVSEVVGVPDVAHYGVYPYAAGALVIPAGPGFLSPSVGAEYCFEFARWGFIGGLAYDLPLSEHFGVDVLATFAHDQEGAQWGEAVFSAGGGLGTSFFAGAWTFSPSVSASFGLNEPVFALVPSFAVGYTIDLSSKPATPKPPSVGSAK